MLDYIEFLRESPEYQKLVVMYLTNNVDVMGERFLKDNDPYYSISNRKQVMEYPYLKMGEC